MLLKLQRAARTERLSARSGSAWCCLPSPSASQLRLDGFSRLQAATMSAGRTLAGVVHLNCAGSSLLAEETLQAVHKYLDDEAAHGGYEAAEKPANRALLQQPYTALAQLVNCQPDNIAVVNSATAAWQRVFLGLPLWRPGSRIFTSVAEYGSNYIAYLQVQERFGVTIDVIEETPEGDLDIAHLESLLAALEPGVFALVSVSHIPTSSGRVYDAVAVGRAVAKHPGVVYLLDACQSVGQMPVDTQLIGCHFLTATGRKYLRAPRGSGFLYASHDALRDPRLAPAALDVWGGRWVRPDAFEALPSAKRYEEYEMSFAAKVGLGIAARRAVDASMETVWAAIQELAAYARREISAVAGVTVQDRGRTLCGIVSFTVEVMPAPDVKAALATLPDTVPGLPEGVAGVNVAVSTSNSSRLDFTQRGLEHVVRASFHHYNSREDVTALIAALVHVVHSGGSSGRTTA